MTAALLVGGLAGLGMLAIGRGVLPYRPPLARALASLQQPVTGDSSPSGGLSRSRLRLARRFLLLAESVGLDPGRQASDLRILGRTAEQHMLAKLGAAVVLGALPLGATVLALAAGVTISPVLPVLPALALTIVGFLLPDIEIRSRAKERREEFHQLLTSYLDLVAILLAGGAGTETALMSAAAQGHGWGFAQLQAALDRCRLTGETPWRSLIRLGEELGVDELGELAATTGLAGEQGARVRDSLAARAVSMRATQLARLEARAAAATERMTLPMVVMAIGFVLFIGYPAVQQVLGGL